MIQVGCPGRSERFFRDKQARRVGGNGEDGEKRGRGRTERNAEGEGRKETRKGKDGEKREGKERKHSEKEIRSRSHDRLRTNYNPIINN